SLCEEAVSEGHTLPGPWETQELKPSEPTLAVPDSVCTQEPQDPVSMSDPSPVGLETHGQPDVKKEEQFTGNCDGSEVTGADVAPFGVSDDGAAGSEVTEDAAAVKEATEASLGLFCFRSTCGEDQEAVQAQKIWKKAIMLVWRAAANHRYASVFLQPVSDDIAPGYHSIVHRPMDLSAIKKNIESGVIRTTAEFQRDIMLMFQNAIMYNSSDHDVYHMALEMQRDVLEHVQQFLATQLIMQTLISFIFNLFFQLK
uniref:Bromodomain-containing protein 8 n=1 Tax=Oryzias melastigma TaxID=30732 RepID=A0A3B3DLY9_ORYME